MTTEEMIKDLIGKHLTVEVWVRETYNGEKDLEARLLWDGKVFSADADFL